MLSLLRIMSRLTTVLQCKFTALHHAAREGHKDLVLLLLERGADIHTPSAVSNA
jgi:hypothetical protein